VRVPGRPPLMAEAQAGTGFSGQNDPRIHFGLGDGSPWFVDVSVRWCGGTITNHRLRTGRYHDVGMESD
jgi:hypothetical protein